jgi:hypothetical protein
LVYATDARRILSRMTVALRVVSSATLAIALSCAAPPPGPSPSPDAGPASDAGPAADAATLEGSADGGAPVVADAGPTDPLRAPAEQWTWLPVEGMRCGNGAPTGVGVNLTSRSRRVLIILQGGGACWDVASCFVLRGAANLESGYGAAQFEGDRRGLEGSALLDRNATDNPFRDASFVFVPYCTGDMHSGTQVFRYEALGATRDVHHVGGRNLDALLPRLRATIPDAERVWLYGISAGGYGVVLNWRKVSGALAPAPVDALSDCGVPVTPPDGRYVQWRRSWASPPVEGCPECERDFTAVLLAQLRAMRTRRFAQLAYTDDGVLSLFYGLGPGGFAPLVRALHERLATEPNARTFVLSGSEHVMAGAPRALRATDGTVLFDWITQWATDGARWTSRAPY